MDDTSSPNEYNVSILVIDDDVGMWAPIAKYLAEYGYLVEVLHDGASGVANAILGKHDLILLNVMIPVLDGLPLLQQIRQHAAVPVVLLTPRRAPQMCIDGLNAGADDFISKPFGPLELMARVQAVLARTANVSRGYQVVVRDIVLDPRTREVRKSKIPVSVSSSEFDLLNILMRSAGRVVSRRELANALYRRQSKLPKRAIDVHVSHLRRKLESSNQTLIRTIWRLGYLFVATEEVVK